MSLNFFRYCAGIDRELLIDSWACPSISDTVGLEKLLSLAVKEDLIARNGKFVGYGFSRCEPKQEQLSPFSSSFLKRLVAKLAGKKRYTRYIGK